MALVSNSDETKSLFRMMTIVALRLECGIRPRDFDALEKRVKWLNGAAPLTQSIVKIEEIESKQRKMTKRIRRNVIVCCETSREYK